MKISFNTPVPINYTEVGWGTAGKAMHDSLIALGHTVTMDDPKADVQFHWKQPHLIKPVEGKYNIAMFPWESTQFRFGWLDILNGPNIDEVFTTSRWCAKIFEDEGVTKPIKVYPHGIDSRWKPKRRVLKNRPIRYLIVDAEANRKGWQEAFDAFRWTFPEDGESPRVATLTIKSRQLCMARWKDERNMLHPASDISNVTVKIGAIPDDELVALFHNHDVLIYPSWGEGFGFIPMQMLATGGIAITTAEWCEYDKYLGDFALKSSYFGTKWQGEHPGLMCKPDQDHLVSLVRKAYDEFQEQADKHFRLAFDLHEEYDWLKLTEAAFSHVKAKFD